LNWSKELILEVLRRGLLFLLIEISPVGLNSAQAA